MAPGKAQPLDRVVLSEARGEDLVPGRRQPHADLRLEGRRGGQILGLFLGGLASMLREIIK